MAEARQFKIQWADFLVAHFSSFFSAQWDAAIDGVFASGALPEHAESYTMAALQEVLDCATVSAKQALSSGFSPSLNYSKVLQAAPLAACPEACRRVVRDAVKAILKSDRRDRIKRRESASLGDYFFAGLRRLLETRIPDQSLEDHHATACYFGLSGYHGMLASGISADLLLVNYAAQGKRYAASAAAVAEMAKLAWHAGAFEVRKLQLVVDLDHPTESLQGIVFRDCVFAPGAVDVGDALLLERCVVAEQAFRQCIHSRFKACTRIAAPPNPLEMPTGDDQEILPAEFHDCVFEGEFFHPRQAPVQLHDCRFSPPLLDQLHLDRLSGDCTSLDIRGCDIGSISPGSRLGQLSNTRVDNATHAYFEDSLTDVEFTGRVDRCLFGGTLNSSMTRVRFAPDKSASDRTACQVTHSRFAKTMRFDGVVFDCRLQDPVFDGSVAGIAAVRELDLSYPLKQTFQGVDFGVIQTSGQGRLHTLIGGRVFRLDGRVEHATHTLIRTIGERGGVGRYEVVSDSSLRKQWGIKSGPILIGRVQGAIDVLTQMGDACDGVAIGSVSGSISSFQPGITIQQLLSGGRVVFAAGCDIDKALAEHRIADFNGGQFGVWETEQGKASVYYYGDEQEYRHGMRVNDVVRGIFDALG